MDTFNPHYVRRQSVHRDDPDEARTATRGPRPHSPHHDPRVMEVKRRVRKTPGERMLDAPVLVLKVDEEIQRLRKEPEWLSGHENGITLSKYPHLRVVLVALRKGTLLQDHAVSGPMSLFVISGRINVVVGRTKHQLEEKGLCTLRKTIAHRILAVEDSVFLLSIVQL